MPGFWTSHLWPRPVGCTAARSVEILDIEGEYSHGHGTALHPPAACDGLPVKRRALNFRRNSLAPPSGVNSYTGMTTPSSIFMSFRFEPLSISDVIRITSAQRGDFRGFFSGTYRAPAFEKTGIRDAFLQDNHARSARGVLPGLHYSLPGFDSATSPFQYEQ